MSPTGQGTGPTQPPAAGQTDGGSGMGGQRDGSRQTGKGEGGMAVSCFVLAQPASKHAEGSQGASWGVSPMLDQPPAQPLLPLPALAPRQTLHAVRAPLSPGVCLSGGGRCRQGWLTITHGKQGRKRFDRMSCLWPLILMGEVQTPAGPMHSLVAASCSSDSSGVSHISQLRVVPPVLKPAETPLPPKVNRSQFIVHWSRFPGRSGGFSLGLVTTC